MRSVRPVHLKNLDLFSFCVLVFIFFWRHVMYRYRQRERTLLRLPGQVKWKLFSARGTRPAHVSHRPRLTERRPYRSGTFLAGRSIPTHPQSNPAPCRGIGDSLAQSPFSYLFTFWIHWYSSNDKQCFVVMRNSHEKHVDALANSVKKKFNKKDGCAI